MIRSNLIKVTMAFAAGVVLTMGSLIYSRTRELNQLRAAAQSAAVAKATAASRVEVPAQRQEAQISENAGEASGNVAEAIRSKGPAVQRLNEPSDAPLQAEVPGPAVRTQAERTDESGPMPDVRQNSGRKETQATSLPANVPATTPVAPQAEAPKVQPPSSSEAILPHRRPNMATLRTGTALSVRLAENVSTELNRSGDFFRGELDAPLVVNGFVVAERGSAAFGRVVKVKRARLGKSDLRMELTGITTSDGQRIRVQTSAWEEKSARRSIEDTPKRAASAAIGVVVGALSGAARGAGFVSENEGGTGGGHVLTVSKRSVALPAGSRLTFRLAIPVTITERLNYR